MKKLLFIIVSMSCINPLINGKVTTGDPSLDRVEVSKNIQPTPFICTITKATNLQLDEEELKQINNFFDGLKQMTENIKTSNQNKLFDYLTDLLADIGQLISLINNDEKKGIKKQIQKIKDKISNPNFTNQETKELAQKLCRSLLKTFARQAKYHGQIFVDMSAEEYFIKKLEKVIGAEKAKKIISSLYSLVEEMPPYKHKKHGIQLTEASIDIMIPDSQISSEIKEKLIHLFKQHYINSEMPFDDESWDIFSKISLFINNNFIRLSDDKLLMFFNHNDQSEKAKKLRLKLLTKFDSMLNNFELQPIFGEE
ncbi:MAG: hypothetical protein ABIA74_04065 [bacterium]